MTMPMTLHYNFEKLKAIRFEDSQYTICEMAHFARRNVVGSDDLIIRRKMLGDLSRAGYLGW